MNAIIALCHFCEMHGPSVMFCTQSFHDSDDPQSVLEDKCSEQPQTRKKYYGKPEIYQRSLSLNSTVNPETTKLASGERNTIESCEACKLIPAGLSGYISNDHDAKVSYISSHHPFHPEIFSIVRQACVRSLSCEVCQGREGPIFFGDQERGHVYSHTFFVKDSHARGFQRWYSIIVVMMDKIFLLNSWPFLTKHIRTVIDELQEKANKIYQIEQTECPQRVIRLNSLTGGLTPGNFRRPRGGSKTMRSLEELTNDRDVFANLHLWFTWILKAGGNRMTEKLLEGPPTEDTVIDLEKQEETEEGFMLIATKTVTKEVLPSCSTTTTVTKIDKDNNAEMRIRNIQHLWKVLGRDTFRILAYHIIVGNQLIILCDDKGLTKAVFHHLKILLPKGCSHDIPYSETYIDSWKCNMIGLHPTAALPNHVRNSQLHIILEIVNKLGAGCRCRDPSTYRYQILNTSEIPEKGPTVHQKMLGVIENEEFSESVVDEFFISLKEEWMNKVKVLYKFSRAGGPSYDDTNKLLQVLGAHERDKQVLKFWMTGLSLQFKNHVIAGTTSQCHVNDLKLS